MFVIRNTKKIYFKESDRNRFKYYSIYITEFITKVFTLVIENNKYKQTKIVQEIEGSGALVISVEVTDQKQKSTISRYRTFHST